MFERWRACGPCAGYAAGVDLTEAVHAHVELFNDAVRAGDFEAFAASFGEDAVMSFDGVPVGPFRGRHKIATAYQAQPPTDTMSVWSVEEVDAETAFARFDWDNGGAGSMQLRWRDGELVSLTISYET
jgi:steroid Delta-isomerase